MSRAVYQAPMYRSVAVCNAATIFRCRSSVYVVPTSSFARDTWECDVQEPRAHLRSGLNTASWKKIWRGGTQHLHSSSHPLTLPILHPSTAMRPSASLLTLGITLSLGGKFVVAAPEEWACDLRAWTRAPDLSPGLSTPAEARLAANGSACEEIARWEVGLRFKERAIVKLRGDLVVFHLPDEG